uniref:NADH-ubiquinone oxidoreductase chain 2 n=1 Tax=Potamilus alatus TaxID=81573 RepID=A0A1P8AJ36_9BIVA|nr:NADH dehydrogenase subunit 2 [Potamilus alatus]AMZ00189.1 NADH dehydrogenase subunit 2 [Potamilus alatus]
MFFVFSTTLLANTSSNMLFVWLMMELNSLTFIPIIMDTHNITDTETSIKYLIPQTLGSSMFLTSAFLTYAKIQSSPLTSIALLLKLGSAPMHMWFPPVMYSINMTAGLILLTWQKVMPLLLLTNPQLSYPPIVIASAMMSALWGSIAGLNQTNLLILMSFSSINHLGWLLMSSTLNLILTINYLGAYILTITPIMLLMKKHMTKTHSMVMTSLMTDKHDQLILTLSLLSIAGMPPMAMFATKIPIITSILLSTLKITIMPLILSAAISMHFYLALTVTLMTIPQTPSQQPSVKTFYMKPMYTLLIMTQFFWLPLTW